MMHRRQHTYRNFQNYLFQGKGRRLHMVSAPDGESIQAANDNLNYEEVPSVEYAMAQEGRFVNASRAMIPSERIGYNPKNKRDIQKKWQRLDDQLNAAETYMGWLQYQSERIQNPESKPLKDKNGKTIKNAAGEVLPFDIQDSVWESRVRDIYRAHERAYDVLDRSSMASLPDAEDRIAELKTKALANELDAVKAQIIEDIEAMRAGIQFQKDRIEAMMKEEIKADFLNRVEYMQQQWKKNPPNHFKEEPEKAAAWSALLEKTKGAIQGLSADTPYDYEDYTNNEFRNIHEDLDKLEAYFKEQIDFDEKLESRSEQLTKEALKEKLGSVEEYRKEQVGKVRGEFNKQMSEAQSKVRSLITTAKRTSVDRFEGGEAGQKEMIENLEKTLASLVQTQNIDAFTKSVLYDNEKQTEAKDSLPKSLNEQIDAIFKEGEYTDEEKKVLALGVDEALDKYKHYLSDEANLLGNLARIADRVDVMASQITLSKPSNTNIAQGRFFGYKMYFLAPYDMVRASEIIGEWGKRTYNRAARRRLGEFGSQTLSFLDSDLLRIFPTKTLPNEFDKEAENAEQEEVNVYKEAYGNKDAWQIEEIAMLTTNSDEFKACLLLLAERGRLRWDKLGILKQFNRFQSAVNFEMDRRVHLQDMAHFHEKLNIACGSIWDFDTFRDMDKQNTSSYNSKMQEYTDRIHMLCDSGGGLKAVLDDMLHQQLEFKRGNAGQPKFDPLLYDRIIEYSIQQGKLAPEAKLYYLIQGIAHGILPPDRGSHYSSTLINDYPAIDFFGSTHAALGHDAKPDLQLIQKVAEMDVDAFQDFFHNYIMNLKQVRERVNKVLSARGKLDHDDFTATAPYLGAQAVENMLTARSDGYGIPETGAENATESMLFYLRHFASNRGGGFVKDSQIADFIGAFVRFDGITQGRMYKGKTEYFRFGQHSVNKKPRVSGLYGSYGLKENERTVRQNLDISEGYIKQIDPEFFGFLFDKNSDDSKVAGLLKKLESKYGVKSYKELFDGNTINSLNDLHTYTGEFVASVMKTDKGFGAYQKMISSIQKDNQSFFEKQKEAGKKTIEDKRKEFFDELRRAPRDLNAGEVTGGAWFFNTTNASNNADYYKNI